MDLQRNPILRRNHRGTAETPLAALGIWSTGCYIEACAQKVGELDFQTDILSHHVKTWAVYSSSIARNTSEMHGGLQGLLTHAVAL